ncbi:kinase-like protein [Lophium mytilinum]|uniref:non-specific serine/threonine protein kinase n=1 Tax=Lophium mytilinum TaxID=390894 RepID=A0A6A6QQI0_9PEZI|nr:kinase-like protein [Lophium mytilinum]
MEEGAEWLEGYQSGGFHPTLLGEYYHEGRYKVIHKLGHGSYSTVWLACDTVDRKNVALKILSADRPSRNRETEIMRLLTSEKTKDQGKKHPGSAYVLSILDEFFIEGPNGKHLCVVTPLAGGSVSFSKECARESPGKFPLSASRSIVAQIALGLEYIHSCGIVHGDLHCNNIFLEIPGLDTVSETEIYSYIGEPRKFPIERVDDLLLGPETPAYYVLPAMIELISDETVHNPKIVIGDFGEAYFSTDARDRGYLNTPIKLRPPEAFFNEYLGAKVDVWTLACTAFEILGTHGLFTEEEDLCIAEMINHLGPLPERWWETWEAKDEFFYPSGAPRDIPQFKSLAEHMLAMGRGQTPEASEFSKDEFIALEILFKKMLTYESVDRITSSEVVASDWMQNWAVGDLAEPAPRQALQALLEGCREFGPIFKEQDKKFLAKVAKMKAQKARAKWTERQENKAEVREPPDEASSH